MEPITASTVLTGARCSTAKASAHLYQVVNRHLQRPLPDAVAGDDEFVIRNLGWATGARNSRATTLSNTAIFIAVTSGG